MVMLKRIAAPLALVVALACAGPVLAADATVEQVYQAARAGHLDEAQQLMDQVLKDHPTSAKAHYVEAELSAKAGNLARGRTELAEAQRLDPSGAFAKPEALAALQRELAGRGTSRGPTGYYPAAPAPRAEERRSGIPWPIILLVVAGVVIAWALLSRRSTRNIPARFLLRAASLAVAMVAPPVTVRVAMARPRVAAWAPVSSAVSPAV
jgi:uncharacterized protein